MVGEIMAAQKQSFNNEKAPVKKIEGHPVTREAIERLIRIREQIMQDRQRKPFSEDSTEILRQEREKRTRYLMGEEDGL
jgi:hypothetical protein